LDWTQSNLQDL